MSQQLIRVESKKSPRMQMDLGMLDQEAEKRTGSGLMNSMEIQMTTQEPGRSTATVEMISENRKTNLSNKLKNS